MRPEEILDDLQSMIEEQIIACELQESLLENALGPSGIRKSIKYVCVRGMHGAYQDVVNAIKYEREKLKK